MVRVSFTPSLRRHLSCPSVEAKGRTVAVALTDVFVETERQVGCGCLLTGPYFSVLKGRRAIPSPLVAAS